MTGSGERRELALDGLRGLAALVVVLHHISFLWPAMADPYRGAPVHGPAALLTTTPLRLLVSGPEAVLVFFVLSGLVLTRPLLAEGSVPRWPAYYPRRLARLYLPVWGSLAVAAVLAAVSSNAAPLSWAFGAQGRVTPRGLAHDAVLLRGVGFLNGPLWSLRWEVWFSLLLPAYVFWARRARRGTLVWSLVVGALVAVGSHRGSGALSFLPVFAAGALLAAHWDRLAAARVTTPAWGLLVASSCVLVTAPWTARGLGAPAATAIWAAAPLVVLGATGLVAAFAFSPGCRALGTSRPVLLLGRRSFSLYLVHWPLLHAVASWSGGHRLAGLAVYAVLLPPVVEAFHRGVEHPSLLLSRRVGSVVARRLGPTRASGAQPVPGAAQD